MQKKVNTEILLKNKKNIANRMNLYPVLNVDALSLNC